MSVQKYSSVFGPLDKVPGKLLQVPKEINKAQTSK